MSHRPEEPHRGFTLVEVLVAISIIAILLAFSLPALVGARGSAERVVSLSRAKQLHAAIEMYANGSSGMYPAIDEEKDYPNLGGNGSFRFPYWQISETWFGVIWDVLPAEGSNLGVFYSPGVERLDRVGQMPPSYAYSTSFAGRPELWTPKGEPRTRYQRSAMTHEVRFPSSKAILWDGELGWLRDTPKREGQDLDEKTPMMMADGSGSQRIPAAASDAFPNPIAHALDRAKLHNTAEGVYGRDY